MRLRKKWWARPEMESCPCFITTPDKIKGHWNEMFGNKNDVHLELGCGRGKFITENAENNPNINYIGIDIKDEVLIYAVRKIQQMELENVRIIPMNISFIEDIFEKDEISRVYINFCNPWPKERHKKRRLTHPVFLNRYKNFIRPKSEIWFKTDDKELFDESIEYFSNSGFELEFITYDLHKSGFASNITTEYEEKFTSIGMNTMFLIARLMDTITNENK